MSGPNGETGPVRQEPDLAQAFKDLARGEQTADALEKNLNALEKKIEELLAHANEQESKMEAKQSIGASTSTESKDTP